jgi:hypothetical protein
LTYDASSETPIIQANVDADWGGCGATRRSTTGYIVKTFGGVVSWRSTRQDCVAQSTTEAEFMASSLAANNLLWIRRFLEELGCLPPGPTILQNDNMGAVHLSTSTYNHPKTKHIDLRVYSLREHVESGQVELKHIPGKSNVADTLTKALPRVEFERWRGEMGMQRIPIPGGVSGTEG